MEETKEKIIEYLREVKKKVKIAEIEENIGATREDREKLVEVLNQLEQKGNIVRCKKGKYVLTQYSEYISGIVQGNERGYAFFRPTDKDLEDMFIKEEALNGALDKDAVLVKESAFATSGNKKECVVYRIIKDSNETLIGTVAKRSNKYYVIPDNKRVPYRIVITGGKLQGVKNNQKVIVEITKRKVNPYADTLQGEIVDILGDKNEKGVDILSIAKTYGLEQEFPADVTKECDKIKDFVDPEIIKNRVDLRNVRMVTIDGEDAKDLDDAVSIEILDNGNYKLGVHIADVSEYVKEGSFLDKEAQKRGTSVYLIDRVIPMLPKKLSNGICSLNPNVDRLAFSVIMEINQDGGVVSHDIFESVININERMTYKNVYKILEQNDEQLKERYKDVVDDFYKMRILAKILSNKRAKRGAIDFKFGESKITLDENGKPIDVSEYEITVANKIIEEFMLVCNETVAEHFYWLNIPFVYRIHEEPNGEKMLTLAQFVNNLGYKLKVSQKVYPKALQQVLSDISGKKEERIISTVMLRSMQKAKYTTEHKGHFGLAAKYYSHFTSPIRRYPDLIIHRIMKEVINNKFDNKRRRYYEENLEEIAKRCSETERIAQDAERDVENIKKCEYMHQYEGYVFDGIISSITAFGMFVELPNTIEGLVRMGDMHDDYYNFDEASYSLIGERTGKKYHIGDQVKVLVARADKEAKQIDFVLASNKPNVGKKAIFKSAQEIMNKEKKKRNKKRRGNDNKGWNKVKKGPHIKRNHENKVEFVKTLRKKQKRGKKSKR